MFGMGMTIDFKDIKRVLSQPIWIVITVVLQFTIMPLIAFFLIKLLNIDLELALGFIILGSCPGGTASNVITYLCNGNVALSVMCTLVSTLLAVIITPFLILVLANENIEVDFFKLMKSTFLIVFFPVVLGLLIKSFMQKDKKELLNCFPKISEIIIAFIIAIIFSLNFENFISISSNVIFGVIFHNALGLFLGYFISSMFGYPVDVKKTISIEVGMQNSGFGMALALIHFSKISALPSAIFSLWHNISAVGLVYFWKKK